MKYNPQEIEDKWYAYWLENDLFSSKPNKKKPYTVLMPPPNVTGILHMGHMLNNTIQDVLIRRARLLGFNACWVPGTDHASIATEAKVISKLKKQGVDKSSLSRKEFLQHAWDWTNTHGGIILQQLKKIGASCDWDRVKFTMDDDMSASVTEAFIKLYEKGFIYRGNKMINWDPQAKTALSDEEVIYKEQDSNLYYIDYQLINCDKIITIATTRPETILGDTAICVHPEDSRYKDLIGEKVFVPLVNREIPVISDEYIDKDFGTGALKVTPAHDINDYIIGEKNNLDIICVIDENGCIDNEGQLYIGEDRFLVRKKIIADIKKIGQLNKVESIKNKVGFSERTDVVIEPRLSTQWFMKMKKMAEPALINVLNNNIHFYPPKTKNTYKHWMSNIRDWCLSRQLWWGHQIPVYYYHDSDYVVAKNKEEALMQARQDSGDQNLNLEDLIQDNDVLDTWFSSWLWPISVFDGIRQPKSPDFLYYYPTTDLVTGPDILFFWVARMIMCGYEFSRQEPFKNVYFTGIVRDGQRRKMSKSLGNSPDPIKLINQYGADGVRAAMLFASPAGNDLLFDESLCEQGRNFSNKIWNAFRLIDSWEEQKIEQNRASFEAVVWFENRLSQDIHLLNTLFQKFRISDCLMTLYKLIWNDFCSSYLEIIKPFDKVVDVQTKEKTFYFFETILILLHPFMPFITEDIWQKLKKRKSGQSISLCTWPISQIKKIDQDILLKFEHNFKLIAAIRKIRKDKNISFKDSLVLLVENRDVLFSEEIIKKTCNINTIDILHKNTTVFPFLVDKTKYYIPLVFDINIEFEIQSIKEKIDYLKVFLKSIEKKISNPKFIQNAPKNVIMLEEKKKNDTLIKLESLQKELQNFDEENKNI